jgi:hypothetical protein
MHNFETLNRVHQNEIHMTTVAECTPYIIITRQQQSQCIVTYSRVNIYPQSLKVKINQGRRNRKDYLTSSTPIPLTPKYFGRHPSALPTNRFSSTISTIRHAWIATNRGNVASAFEYENVYEYRYDTRSCAFTAVAPTAKPMTSGLRIVDEYARSSRPQFLPTPWK